MKTSLEEEAMDEILLEEEEETEAAKFSTRPLLNAINAISLDTFTMNAQYGIKRKIMQSWMRKKKCF